jgi:hypothetical protein
MGERNGYTILQEATRDRRVEAKPVMSRQDRGCCDLFVSADARWTVVAYVEAPDPNINLWP